MQDSQRGELESSIISKAMKDPGFREKLKSDPRGALEAELGGRLPENINIHINEEDTNNIYITLPRSPGELSGELSSEELSGVSGGWSLVVPDDNSCLPLSGDVD